MDAPALRIGQVAEATGLPVKTVRFYCDEGLIQPTSRSDGGFRLFNPEALNDLAFIRTLRGLDIPLHDVMKILESRRSGICTCTSLQSTIRSKAGEIEHKITALRAMHVELMELLNHWQDCGGRKP